MSNRILKDRRGLSLFFLAYYVLLVLYGATTGSSQTAFYAAFVAAGAGLVGWLYRRFPLTPLVLWGLALWGFAHMLGGLVEIDGKPIYEWSFGADQARFDKIVHFFGFGMATLAAYEVVRAGGGMSPRRAAVVAGLVGLGIGAINETVEFLITLLPTESNVGGFSNTGWDLVANTAGAAAAALLAPRLETRSG